MYGLTKFKREPRDCAINHSLNFHIIFTGMNERTGLGFFLFATKVEYAQVGF